MATLNRTLQKIQTPAILAGAAVLGLSFAAFVDPGSRISGSSRTSTVANTTILSGNVMESPASVLASDQATKAGVNGFSIEAGPSAPGAEPVDVDALVAALERGEDGVLRRFSAAYKSMIGQPQALTSRLALLDGLRKYKDPIAAEATIHELVTLETLQSDGLVACGTAGQILSVIWASDAVKMERARGILYGEENAQAKLMYMVALADSGLTDMGSDLLTLALSGSSPELRSNALLTMGRAADKDTILTTSDLILARLADGPQAEAEITSMMSALVILADREPTLSPSLSGKIQDRLARTDLSSVAFATGLEELARFDLPGAIQFARSARVFDGTKRAVMRDFLKSNQ